MKHFSLFTLLFVFTFSLSAQVYVDADATGTGDGSTWANAYPNLNDALLAAPSGASVWIAEGTYTTPDSVSFFINKELAVLGGFNGTEGSAAEADPAANETILSGDVLGNDLVGTYDSTAFADNNRILFIQDVGEVSSYTVTLDGLTFTNGGLAQNHPDSIPRAVFSGGAIRTFARTNASRLKFTANRASFGSAVAVAFSSADGSVFEDITLEGNFSGSNHQFFIDGTDDVVIRNSRFIGNEEEVQPSGFLYMVFSLGVTVDSCSFTNLTTPTGRGAGLLAIECDRLLVKGSTFNGLIGSLGGAVHVSQSSNSLPADGETMGLDDYTFDNCMFTNNSASQRGGAITALNANLNVTNSVVTGNRSSVIGGAFFVQLSDSRSYEHNYSNTTISNNRDAGAGGGVSVLIFNDASLTGTMDSNTMDGNVSGNDGQGALLYLQGPSDFTITNCDLSDNVAGFGTLIFRGAVDLDLKNVTFENNGNSANSFRGAGIVAYFAPGSPGITMDSCAFINNSVGQNPNFIRSGGAAMYLLSEDDTEYPVSITNSTFRGNSASGSTPGDDIFASAGAIFISGPLDLTIDNCDFTDNTTGGDGGAIHIISGELSRDTTDGVVSVINETFSGNISNSRFFNSTAGNQGGAIATRQVMFDLTNCVFVNNVATNAGGGAISFNGNVPVYDDFEETFLEIGSLVLDATLVNNTFALNRCNESAFGDDISLFQPGDTNDPDSNSMQLILLNNAFLNANGRPGIEVEPGNDEPDNFVPVGDLFVQSLGGNFYNTGIDPLFTLNSTDINNTEIDEVSEITALFVDLEGNDGAGPNADLVVTDPLTDNPLINNGTTNALVPATDVRGNPRGDFPDIGAYEADQDVVSTGDPLENSGLDITFFPNPTQGILNVRNDETSIDRFTLIVADQNGRILKANRFNGSNNHVDFTNLPAGVYNLQVVVNGKVYSKQIVKQ